MDVYLCRCRVIWINYSAYGTAMILYVIYYIIYDAYKVINSTPTFAYRVSTPIPSFPLACFGTFSFYVLDSQHSLE